MKARCPRFSTPRVLAIAAFGTTLLSASAFAQVMNPDPDIFDGTKTKHQAIQQDTSATKTDDWEGDNLIVYDSNDQGSEQGGLGRTGYDKPGMDIGIEGPSMGVGIPIPIGGGMGAGGQPGLPSISIPQGAEAGADAAGMTPPGAENGDQANSGGGGDQSAEGLGVKSAVKPGDVPIGDDNQKIKGATVAGAGDAGQAASAQGGQGNQATQDGGQSANVGGAAGAQSGRRGTGVEKGDAMPSDM